MAYRIQSHEIIEKSKKAGFSRRTVLTTIVSASAAVALPKGAEARQERHTRRAMSIPEANFWTAVKAFNNMWTITNPNGYMLAQSPLWNVLDPQALVFNIRADAQKAGPGREAVIYYLYNLAGAQFKPNSATFLPNKTNPVKVRGTAYWKDIDGSSDDPAIPFTFRFNNDLIILLRSHSS